MSERVIRLWTHAIALALVIVINACAVPSWAQTTKPGVTPATTAPSASQESYLQVPGQVTHVVKEGDTLWGLSNHYRGNPELWREIGDPNGVMVPKRMQPGTILQLGSRQSSQYAGRVVALTGDVRISNVRAASTGKLVNDAPLRLGMSVPVGAQLRTGLESFVTLVLNDAPIPLNELLPPERLMSNGKPVAGTLVTLPSQSHVKIISIRDPQGKGAVVLELFAGQIDSRAQPATELRSGSSARPEPFSQQIRTRVATVGVRGTYFRVSLPEGEDTMTTSVLEGAVEAQSESKKEVVRLDKSQGAVIGPKGIASQGLLAAPRWLEGNEEQNFPDVNLTWQAIAGAKTYRVQVAKDAWFIDILAQKQVPALGGANSENVEQTRLVNLPQGTYFARVSAFTADDLEGQFSVLRFQRDTYQISTASSLIGQTKEVQLEWNALPNASYEVEVATEQALTEPIVKRTGISSNRIRVSALPPGVYVWRIKGQTQRNGQSLTVTSPWEKFTVTGAR